MDKIKLLTFSVIALLLINLATLGFLFLNGQKGNDRERNKPRPREIIIEKLHFDEKQQKEYDKLISWHKREIRQLEDNIRHTKNALYSELLKPEADIKIKDSLISILAMNQKQIEMTHFKHFQDIKKLCRNEQMADYYALTEELSKIFSQRPKPRND